MTCNLTMTPEQKREQLRTLYPDLYAFLVVVREIFGPVRVRIKQEGK